jgi:hypothetical protein
MRAYGTRMSQPTLRAGNRFEFGTRDVLAECAQNHAPSFREGTDA